MREESICFDCGDSGGKNGRLCQRLGWGLAESTLGGSMESGGRFCVGASGRNLASVNIGIKMFSYLILY
jgi:hypothetical protein